ncbi:SDR family NAD(P)-dependent oxidoreductase [Actinokineospora sp. HUAS TT18]|uniref:SDR family NAD(P)-dependent oxidoreductase n=1 Tax=Actinokineospora sp. HUAS TT18 TaxID=3447451 RepID=UPI003F522471
MTRNVIVSGGGTGIGRAVAARFAQDGDQVVLLGRRADVLDKAAAEIAGPGPAPIAVAGDLADPVDVEKITAELVDRLGHIDVLVASAGGNATFNAPAGLSGVAGVAWNWTENFRLNTLTAVLITEALRPHLADSARVLLISSIAAYRGSGSGSYAASKAALHPYAYDLASALGGRGITVNVVAPGYIADTEFFQGKLAAEREKTLISQTHTGRAGTPADVADTTHWLASAAAGQVTGQIIQVNGGAERGR